MAEKDYKLHSLLSLDVRDAVPQIDTLTTTQKKVLKIVQDDDFAFGSPTDKWRKAQELFPLANYLVEPRGILEYFQLREAILEKLHEGHIELFTPNYYLDRLVYKLSVLPYWVVDSVVYYGNNPNEVLKDFVVLHDRKIGISKEVEIDKVPQIVEEHRNKESVEGEELVATTFGKWRNGFHERHIETIRLARQVVGGGGLYILIIESKESILSRLGKDTYCLSDAARVKQATELESVDHVCVVDPGTTQEEAIYKYYKGLWGLVNPDYYIFGARDDDFAEKYIENGKSLGTIVLWSKEKADISTSKRIEDIKQKNLK